jgi:very-short-patch-repair endonuclease
LDWADWIMPHSHIDAKTRGRARTLRRELTKAERAMWSMLRDLRPYGGRFRRETPIGPYIADFAWLSARLIIEVDGDSHEWTGRRKHDQERDAFSKRHGFTILRFDNDQVIDGPDHVFIEIERHIAHLLRNYPGEPAPF